MTVVAVSEETDSGESAILNVPAYSIREIDGLRRTALASRNGISADRFCEELSSSTYVRICRSEIQNGEGKAFLK